MGSLVYPIALRMVNTNRIGVAGGKNKNHQNIKQRNTVSNSVTQ